MTSGLSVDGGKSMSMRFLGIAGSVCAKSTSKGLLRAAAANLPARVEMAIADQMRALATRVHHAL